MEGLLWVSETSLEGKSVLETVKQQRAFLKFYIMCLKTVSTPTNNCTRTSVTEWHFITNFQNKSQNLRKATNKAGLKTNKEISNSCCALRRLAVTSWNHSASVKFPGVSSSSTWCLSAVCKNSSSLDSMWYFYVMVSKWVCVVNETPFVSEWNLKKSLY